MIWQMRIYVHSCALQTKRKQNEHNATQCQAREHHSWSYQRKTQTSFHTAWKTTPDINIHQTKSLFHPNLFIWKIFGWFKNVRLCAKLCKKATVDLNWTLHKRKEKFEKKSEYCTELVKKNHIPIKQGPLYMSSDFWPTHAADKPKPWQNYLLKTLKLFPYQFLFLNWMLSNLLS